MGFFLSEYLVRMHLLYSALTDNGQWSICSQFGAYIGGSWMRKRTDNLAPDLPYPDSIETAALCTQTMLFCVFKDQTK